MEHFLRTPCAYFPHKFNQQTYSDEKHQQKPRNKYKKFRKFPKEIVYLTLLSKSSSTLYSIVTTRHSTLHHTQTIRHENEKHRKQWDQNIYVYVARFRMICS